MLPERLRVGQRLESVSVGLVWTRFHIQELGESLESEAALTEDGAAALKRAVGRLIEATADIQIVTKDAGALLAKQFADGLPGHKEETP